MSKTVILTDDETAHIAQAMEAAKFGNAVARALHDANCTVPNCPELHVLVSVDERSNSVLRKLGVSFDSPEECHRAQH